MDRKFLQDLKVEGLENGLPKEVIDEIMKQYGTSVKEKDKQIEDLKTEKDGINKQLEDANNKIQSFKDIDVENLNSQIKEWETKYNQDTENLKNELSQKDYDYKLKDLISSIKFSSNGAKRAFIEDLKSQDLKFDDKGTLVGFDDFRKSYEETDPNVFMNESNDDNNGFTTNTGANHTDSTDNDDEFINKIMGIK